MSADAPRATLPTHMTMLMEVPSLMSAGRVGSEHPKRFYKFALIDPVDKPFATFRYHYRTWAQLRQLGLSEIEVVEDGESNALSIIEPDYASVSVYSRDDGFDSVSQQGPEDMSFDSQDAVFGSPSSAVRMDISTGSPVRRTTGLRRRQQDSSPTPSRLSVTRTSSAYRLSFPPSYRLDPPERSSRPMPAIPYKHSLAPNDDTSYQPHPAYPINDWERRTPSPVQSMRETISTPTMERKIKRGFTPTGWLNAIGNAWKRRGTPSYSSNDNGSRAASRSDSRGVR